MNLNLKMFVLSLASFVKSSGLNEEFTWTRINYDWQNQGTGVSTNRPYGSNEFNNNRLPDIIIFDGLTNADAQSDIQSDQSNKQTDNASNNSAHTVQDIKDYQYENNIPMGANVWQNKLFITVPRRRLGVPSTLNYVPLNSPTKDNVPLIPYPNWRSNVYPDPIGTNESFVSVYRVAVDSCDRLWFVDTGLIELPDNPIRVKPSELVIIDLQTNNILRRYVIPEDQVGNAALASVTVDVTVEKECHDTFAYIPDLAGYHLIVYSYKDNRSWRITHNYFYLEPLAGEFFISGHHFQWNDGVFSVELTDTRSDGFRDLYFHSMAGTHLYKVSTRILRNETLATRSYHGNDFKVVGDRGSLSQTSAADIHKSLKVLFLGLVNQNAVACWNINTDLKGISIVQQDNEKMIYPSDVKVYGDKLYVLTNTMPEFLYGRLNYDKVNFRVWSANVKDAISGTQCDVRL